MKTVLLITSFVRVRCVKPRMNLFENVVDAVDGRNDVIDEARASLPYSSGNTDPRWRELLAKFAGACKWQEGSRALRPGEFSEIERLTLCSISIDALIQARAANEDTVTLCSLAAYACVQSASDIPISVNEEVVEDVLPTNHVETTIQSVKKPSFFAKSWKTAVDQSTRLMNKIERSIGLDISDIYEKCLAVHHDHFPCRDVVEAYNSCRGQCKTMPGLASINACVTSCRNEANTKMSLVKEDKQTS